MQRFISTRVTVCAMAALLVAALLPATATVLLEPGQAQAATAAPTLTVTRAATGKVILKKGTTYKLGATATAGAKVTYESSKKCVACVCAKGLVKAKKLGTATITVTAKAAGKTTVKKVKVTVVKACKYHAVKKITAKVKNACIAVGASTKVTATVAPAKASNKNVTYKSSNPKVATVNAYGKVKAKKAGTVTITSTSCANAKKKARVKVTVVPAGKKNADPGKKSDADAIPQGLTWQLETGDYGYGAYAHYTGTAASLKVPATLGDQPVLSLYCNDNQLTSLNVSAATQLRLLDCSSNKLAALDVSKCTLLECLYCAENPLTKLDLSACSQLMLVDCEPNVEIIGW